MAKDLKEFQERLVQAWEACEGGKQVNIYVVERWLNEHMHPLIVEARADLALHKTGEKTNGET